MKCKVSKEKQVLLGQLGDCDAYLPRSGERKCLRVPVESKTDKREINSNEMDEYCNGQRRRQGVVMEFHLLLMCG